MAKTTVINNEHWYTGDYVEICKVEMTAMFLDLGWEEEYDPAENKYYVKLYEKEIRE